MKGQTEYTYAETLNLQGAVVRIFRPVLTEEERNRRTKELYQATVNFLREVEKSERAV